MCTETVPEIGGGDWKGLPVDSSEVVRWNNQLVGCGRSESYSRWHVSDEVGWQVLRYTEALLGRWIRQLWRGCALALCSRAHLPRRTPHQSLPSDPQIRVGGWHLVVEFIPWLRSVKWSYWQTVFIHCQHCVSDPVQHTSISISWRHSDRSLTRGVGRDHRCTPHGRVWLYGVMSALFNLSGIASLFTEQMC